jgi:hypothetical protein
MVMPTDVQMVSMPIDLKEICPKKTDLDKTLELFKALKHVSERTAFLLHSHFHISDLLCMRTKVDHIAELQYQNGRCVGMNRAKKIMESVCPLNVLCSLPGVSRVTAKALLDQLDVRDICGGADLCEIRIGNRKLGKNVIESIRQHLHV